MAQAKLENIFDTKIQSSCVNYPVLICKENGEKQEMSTATLPTITW